MKMAFTGKFDGQTRARIRQAELDSFRSILNSDNHGRTRMELRMKPREIVNELAKMGDSDVRSFQRIERLTRHGFWGFVAETGFAGLMVGIPVFMLSDAFTRDSTWGVSSTLSVALSTGSMALVYSVSVIIRVIAESRFVPSLLKAASEIDQAIAARKARGDILGDEITLSAQLFGN